MFKKWLKSESKEQEVQEIQISIEKEKVKKSIFDCIEEKEKKIELQKKEMQLSNDLMAGIMKFREETKSLDYIRDEIELTMKKKEGELTLMKGFAEAFQKRDT